MSRNRVFYQTNAVLVGPTPATGDHFSAGNTGDNLVKQLIRVQSANFDASVTRTDINELGVLGAIGREIIEQPTVRLDISYYVANAVNERNLGLYVSGDYTAVKDLLNKTQDEKNYFLGVAPEGVDFYNWTGNSAVICVGNGFLSSYSTEAAVGGVPTASVSIEGLQFAVRTGSTLQNIPAVNPIDGSTITGRKFTLPVGTTGTNVVAALRPGDITVDLGNAGLGFSVSDAKIQSYNISFDLSRENLNKMGSRFAFAKEIRFPVTVSVSVTANIGDLTTGELSDILCNDQEYDLAITLREPACQGSGPVAVKYDIKKVKLDSQSLSNDLGGSTSVTLNLSTQLSGPNVTDRGFFISGKV